MTKESERTTQIVILGAGYGGLSALLTLRQRLDWRRRSLTLVNKHSYHYFTTELHTLAAGTDEEENVSIALSQVVRPPARLLVAEVERVVPEESRVILRPTPPLDADGQPAAQLAHFSLPYDYLIIALGNEPEYHHLPGVEENSLVLRSLRSAEVLRDRLEELARLPAGGRYPEVVIAGGGLTGVELAGEIADSFQDRLRLTIVEGAPDILHGTDPRLVQVSRRALLDKGVTLLTGVRIERADPGRLYLQDGATLPFDLLVWTGGVRGPALLAKSGFATTPKGRGLVNDHLQAQGFPNVYLVGDCACLIDPATGREMPPMAQAAVQMGTAAARSILDRLVGLPDRPFHPRFRGIFLSLGTEEGVGQIGMNRYQGLPAVVIKELIEGHHAWEAGGLLQILRRVFHHRAVHTHDGRPPLHPPGPH